MYTLKVDGLTVSAVVKDVLNAGSELTFSNRY